MYKRGRRGSNQHRTRQRGGWKRWLVVYTLAVLAVICFAQYFKNEGKMDAYAQMPIIAPIPAGGEFNLEVVEEEETPEQEQIRAYIKEVFGENAGDAFKLLSCENSSLNPKAVNTAGNEPVGSRDTGVFQINEYWQKVQYKFLLNWKINVQIAHQIYTENGNSFERWTCGRKLGV